MRKIHASSAVTQRQCNCTLPASTIYSFFLGLLPVGQSISAQTRQVNSIFERFTEKAGRVIFFARYEASQYGSSFIETEHLLLGLMRENGALILRSLRPNCTAADLRSEIDKQIPLRQRIPASQEVPLTEECKKVLSALRTKPIAWATAALGRAPSAWAAGCGDFACGTTLA